MLLQCGHGFEAVGNSNVCGLLASARPSAFNAATASKPWVTGGEVNSFSRLVIFNAATASKPWVTIKLTCHGCGDALYFNAATASKPWVTGTPRVRQSRTSNFNAATASKPWVTQL